MATYSHSRLSTYEDCPLKYKLCYLDGIKREAEGVEAFLGTMVHDTLRKCYDDAKLTKVNSVEDLLSYYDALWGKSWHDGIVITKKDLTQSHYNRLGKKMIETYYKRYAPFDSDITIGTEMNVTFSLDDKDQHKLLGYIDRLSRTDDDVYQIHDYKTSAHLPSQKDADGDRQLALYQIGIRKRWPDIGRIKLIWHYLAHGTEIVSYRSDEDISRLVADTISTIDQIEATEDFPPRESGLCDWCEYPDLCPKRKHFFKVEALPVNEYLKEPGVVLVNKYVELKEKASEIKDELKQRTSEIEEEMDKVKEALIDYAKREQVELIKGSSHKARVKIEEKLKFPGKNDDERQELEDKIKAAGKWMEVSQLDPASLSRAVDNGLWGKELIEEVLKYGIIEEGSSIYISRLREGEE